jgi:hypothetical protein
MAQKMTGFQDPYLGPQWHVIKSNAAVIIKIKCVPAPHTYLSCSIC